ncbi:MAG: hypothetical protein JWP58_2757 [Hymenobacter sp.]|nr:hypothetical protein [Hymenobacter sp.]
MIFEALQLLRAELAAYLTAPGRDEQAQVELGNIASGTEDQVLLSLVNLEEEAALRNSTPYQRNPTGGFDVVNPPVFLNLFVLVAAYSRDNSTYATALKRIAWAVQCFQQRNNFSVANTLSTSLESAADPALLRLRLSLDLYSLSFEKVSQLWTTLGGKQMPCVLYKVRLVEEQAEGRLGHGPAITSIEQRPLLAAR